MSVSEVNSNDMGEILSWINLVIPEITRMLEGAGFPRGITIPVSGKPGNGKNAFNTHFLYEGERKIKTNPAYTLL